MNLARVLPAVLVAAFLSGCGGNAVHQPVSNSTPCVPSASPEFSYVLTGYAVQMFSVNSCTGEFSAVAPYSVSTGYSFPQYDNSEQMVTDPQGRFAYVANLVSNVSGPSSISMFTINGTTGALTPTSPATVATGWLPQGIAIDPQGRFVYTANSDDGTVSMFTINQSTGVLTPTQPASVSTFLPNEPFSQPGFLTVDPTGKFLYVTTSLSDGAAVFMYTINQTTGVLTPTSPAIVQTGGIPFQVRVAPNGKFAYVVNNLAGSGQPLGVFQYTVNPETGVLTPNTPAAVATGNAPTGVVVDPTSHFAYVVNRLDNTLSMYTIDQTTGNLTLNATAANPAGTASTGTEPFRVDFDASGKFLYVTNEQSPASLFTVNSDGTLTGTTVTGTAGLSIAFRSAGQ